VAESLMEDPDMTMRTIPFLVALLLCAACGDSNDPESDDGGTTATSTTSSSGSSSTSSGAGGGGVCDGVTPQRNIVSPEELLAMLDNKDFELINVHVPFEGEIVGTDTHLAYTDVPAIEAYLQNDLGKKALLYCFTGPMSEIAGDALVAKGYCNIYDMPAGLYTWKQLGYPYTE
jgi:rhodanese-related sulfurtransferase